MDGDDNLIKNTYLNLSKPALIMLFLPTFQFYLSIDSLKQIEKKTSTATRRYFTLLFFICKDCMSLKSISSCSCCPETIEKALSEIIKKAKVRKVRSDAGT
jgi:DUF1365 family protein